MAHKWTVTLFVFLTLPQMQCSLGYKILHFTVPNDGDRTHVSRDQSYEANWDSLDTRPMPSWYPGAKLGVFIHWGVYSVPSYGFGAEWFWKGWQDFGDTDKHRDKVAYMEENFSFDFKYQDFAPQFKASLWDPKEWVEIIKASGAK